MVQYSLIPMKQNYDFVGDFHEGLAFVRDHITNFHVGYIDKTAFEVIPTVYFGRFVVKDQPKFVHFPRFEEGRAALINKEGKFGYVNTSHEVCVPFAYDNTFHFSEHLAAVQKGEKWGYVDKMGNTVIPFDYDMAYDFYEDLAIVVKDGKTGYINKKGDVVIDFQFDIQRFPKINTEFHNGYATVVKNHEVGVIDKNGDIVLTPNAKYDYIGIFENGYAIAGAKLQNNPSYGVIDLFGNEVIPSKFSSIRPFGKDYLAADDKGNVTLIKIHQNAYESLDFDEIGDLSEERAVVKKENKYGFIDRYGKLMIPIEFDMVYSFSEGYAAVKKDGKFGLIDPYGHTAIPFVFEAAASCSEGVSVVTKDGERMLCVLERA